MKITDELLDYIGVLARLHIQEEERESTREEISKLVAYMDTLGEVDTSGIEAMSHAFPIQNVFREDVVLPSVDKEQITANAPRKKDGCFQVPKAVE